MPKFSVSAQKLEFNGYGTKTCTGMCKRKCMHAECAHACICVFACAVRAHMCLRVRVRYGKLHAHNVYHILSIISEREHLRVCGIERMCRACVRECVRALRACVRVHVNVCVYVAGGDV